MQITAEQYQAAIPGCCTLEAVEDHAERLMLCWGLVAAIKNNKQMNCEGCEYAIRNPTAE